MRKYIALGALLLVAALALSTTVAVVNAARIPGIVILADMSHGQNAGGLEEVMKMVPEAYWIVLVKSKEDIDSLPAGVKKWADEIRVGGFTDETLHGVDMVIIGQPTLLPSSDEVKALAKWFSGKLKAIWCAADSDYPAQGSEKAQEFCNIIFEVIGSKLRIDYVSVEERTEGYFAGKPYRVLGIVDPPKELAFLKYGCDKVLFHGPGAVAVVLPDGTWANPVTHPVKGVYVIVHTTDKAVIVEHQPKSPGAPGHLGVAYHVGDQGVFPLLAAEVMPNGNVVIASGESPYSGYQGGVTWEYHGYVLSGPRFVRNIILWATHYVGELKEAKKLYALYEEVSSVASAVKQLKSAVESLKSGAGAAKALESLKAQVDALSDKVKKLESAVSSLSGLGSTVDELKSKLSALESSLNSIKSTISSLQSEVSKVSSVSGALSSVESAVKEVANAVNSVSGTSSAGLAVAVIAIIIAIAAIAIALKKK